MAPSGPLPVATNFSPWRWNRQGSPGRSRTASAKSPSTVSSRAGCIAFAWCDPCHAANAFGWHDRHRSLPTWRASAGAEGRGGRSARSARWSGSESAITAAAATPAARQRRSAAARRVPSGPRPSTVSGSPVDVRSSEMGHLPGVEAAATLRLARVHLHHARLDDDGEEVECADRRGPGDLAPQIERRAVAEARERLPLLVPADRAAEVGAPGGEGEEAAVGEPHEVELPLREWARRARRELVHRPRLDEARARGLVRTRREVGTSGADELGGGEDAQARPHAGQEGPATGLGVEDGERAGPAAHGVPPSSPAVKGATSAIPEPCATRPARVRTASPTSAKAKAAWIASRSEPPRRRPSRTTKATSAPAPRSGRSPDRIQAGSRGSRGGRWRSGSSTRTAAAVTTAAATAERRTSRAPRRDWNQAPDEGSPRASAGRATRRSPVSAGQITAPKVGWTWTSSSCTPSRNHGAFAGSGLIPALACARRGASVVAASRSTAAIVTRAAAPSRSTRCGATGRSAPRGAPGAADSPSGRTPPTLRTCQKWTASSAARVKGRMKTWSPKKRESVRAPSSGP